MLILNSDLNPSGDQPEAIFRLKKGLERGVRYQTLLGVTGSGKTFTIANIIADLQRPAIILAPNKTLAAQLYGEMKSFFPENAVEYFVSYYDYYQPEAYLPSTDTFIEKHTSVNEYIEQMRLSTTRALMERKDIIIIASVSAIYGLGDPKLYTKMVLHLNKGMIIDQKNIFLHLTELQYTQNDHAFYRGMFRIRHDTIDIFPAESDNIALRIKLLDQKIEQLDLFDPFTEAHISTAQNYTIYPKTHYISSKEHLVKTIQALKEELIEQSSIFRSNNQFLEEQRLIQRTMFDIEMINELGYCSGIENYSRYLSGRKAGDPPPTLFDYLPQNSILFIDESHITIPQIRGMYFGDRTRKKTLVKHGFRLPSALDNRPLKFEEFEAISPQTIYVSATPGPYELRKSGDAIVDQIVRPTGLLDPIVQVRSVSTQVDDLLSEIKKRASNNERVLVTTLTKKTAENLAEYLQEHGEKVRYLHSEINTLERMEIIRDLRLGIFDTLVGINLLREGLDIPEVSLVAIFDADKEGFLRSERSLIQTIGRAARNIKGMAILYGNTVTPSMKKAIQETQYRRKKQQQYNETHGIIPKALKKKVIDVLSIDYLAKKIKHKDHKKLSVSKETETCIGNLTIQKAKKKISFLEKKMFKNAKNLEFEKAAKIRNEIYELKSFLNSNN